jgi:hypothetical protein
MSLVCIYLINIISLGYLSYNRTELFGIMNITSEKVLNRKNLNDGLARYIGGNVFNQGGDIRDVMSVGKLIKKSDGPQDVDGIIDTLVKYGKETRGTRY